VTHDVIWLRRMFFEKQVDKDKVIVMPLVLGGKDGDENVMVQVGESKKLVFLAGGSLHIWTAHVRVKQRTDLSVK